MLAGCRRSRSTKPSMWRLLLALGRGLCRGSLPEHGMRSPQSGYISCNTKYLPKSDCAVAFSCSIDIDLIAVNRRYWQTSTRRYECRQLFMSVYLASPEVEVDFSSGFIIISPRFCSFPGSLWRSVARNTAAQPTSFKRSDNFSLALA